MVRSDLVRSVQVRPTQQIEPSALSMVRDSRLHQCQHAVIVWAKRVFVRATSGNASNTLLAWPVQNKLHLLVQLSHVFAHSHPFDATDACGGSTVASCKTPTRPPPACRRPRHVRLTDLPAASRFGATDAGTHTGRPAPATARSLALWCESHQRPHKQAGAAERRPARRAPRPRP